MGHGAPVCPFAAAMCRRVLPLSGSIAATRIEEGVVERVLAWRERAARRGVVEPRRARWRRSEIWEGVRGEGGAVGVGIFGREEKKRGGGGGLCVKEK